MCIVRNDRNNVIPFNERTDTGQGPDVARNPAAAILACDFCVVVTASFQLLYVLVAIEPQPDGLCTAM
jgi:hypothetical protein